MNPSSDCEQDGDVLLKPASLDDVPAITALLDAASRHWVGRPTTHAQVRDRLATPNTVLNHDTVVAIDARSDGRSIVGFGHVWPAQVGEIRCFGRTHPDHRGRGVGTAVQGFLKMRAARMAAATPMVTTELTTTSWPSDVEGDALLAQLGYGPARYFLKMVMDFAASAPTSPPADAGIVVRPIGPGDGDGVFAAYVESFAEHWGEQNPDAATWWHERRDASSASYDPGMWLVAVEGDEVVGFAIAKTQEDADGRAHGYVGDLGVRPAWRGRGIGEGLLSRSLQTMRDRGLAYASLDVDTANTTGALRLYTKVGMEKRPNFTIWSTSLGAGPDPAIP